MNGGDNPMKRIIAAMLLTTALTLGAPSGATAEPSVGVVITRDELQIIATWYRDHGSDSYDKHHGKKPGGLPPGIAKNLARGKSLPPGIAKQQLPDGLRHALPPPPRGYDRVIVDGKVLLVEVATQVIHDMLVDIVMH